MPPRDLRIHEVMEAARAGLLREVGDEFPEALAPARETAGYSWYEVDGEHVGLYPINELVACGVLGYEMTLSVSKKIVVNDGLNHVLTIIDEARVAVDGVVYYKEGYRSYVRSE